MGRGIGKALLAEVIAHCEALGLRQMVAVIGDSGNAGSIGLHRSLGFDRDRRPAARSATSTAAGSTSSRCSVRWGPARTPSRTSRG